MTDSEEVNAVAYLRVSKKSQTDGESLEYQESKIRFYCSMNHINIVDIITDIASGGSLERKGIQDVIKLIEHRDELPVKINAVVVHKVDRLTRSFSDYKKLKELMFNPIAKVSLHLAEGAGLIPPGSKEIIKRIKQGEAELEAIRERTRQALAVRRAKGLSIGRPKFGYKYVDGKLVEDKDFYPIFKEVVLRSNLGEPIVSIVEDLRARGISTRAGSVIHRSTVYRWVKRAEKEMLIDKMKREEKERKRSTPIGEQQELF